MLKRFRNPCFLLLVMSRKTGGSIRPRNALGQDQNYFRRFSQKQGFPFLCMMLMNFCFRQRSTLSFNPNQQLSMRSEKFGRRMSGRQKQADILLYTPVMTL